MAKILYIMIFLVIIGSGGYLAYNHFEKPVQEEIESMVSLNIYAQEDLENIITGYSVFQNGGLVSEGKTLKQSPIVIKVNKNSNILIKNYNIDNQTYYITSNEFYSNGFNFTRVKLKLVEPSELKVNVINNYFESYNIIFNIVTENYFNDLIVCAEWTYDIISVTSEFQILEEKPNNYLNYDKCFITNIDIEYESKQINFSYDLWGEPSDSNINFVFIDSDGGISEKDGVDLFSKDTKFTLDIYNPDSRYY